MDGATDDTRPASRDFVSLAVLVTAAVTVSYFFTSYRIGEDARTVGVLALLVVLVVRPGGAWAWVPWAAVLGALLYTIAERPIDVPNHHYMMTYIAGALTLALGARVEDRAELVQKNARWMLVVLMAFATLHKVASPTFRDGSYIGYELARGGFARPVARLVGEPYRVAVENDRRINEFRDQPPDRVSAIELPSPLPYPETVGTVFVISILAIEAWLFVSMLAFPNWVVTHLSLIAFAVSLAVLRQELTFISVVCALGLMACGDRRPWLRVTYAALALLCAAGAIKTLNS